MGENIESSASQDIIQVMNHSNRDELLSLKLHVSGKRLIVAMCENERGRFCKLTDSRSRIIVPSEGISPMRDALASLESAMDNAPSSVQETDPSSTSAPQGTTNEDAKSELIDSERFLSEGRKFYFDVLENVRGRYLKISQSSTRRITLVMPINLLSPLKRAVDMLIEKVPPEPAITDPTTIHRVSRTIERVTPLSDGNSANVTVVQREIRVFGKRVVFESGANRRGSYIKIMETNGPQRMSVILPHSAVPEMIQLLQEVVNSGDPAETMTSVAQNGQ